MEFILPKNNKSMKEAILMRRGERIDGFLVRKFEGLMNVVLVMLAETEKMKRSLVYEHDLNLEDVHARLRQHVKGEKGLTEYLRMNDMEIEQEKICYLRNYIGKKEALDETDLMNIFAPIAETKREAKRSETGMKRGYSQGALK